MSSRTGRAVLVAVWSAVFATAIATNSSAIPEFRRPECDKFRVLLKEHTDVSRFDRKHSTNLGIAGVVLFWSGPPALPLGISAVLMGRRMGTSAWDELDGMKVTKDNYERINQLCGVLLNKPNLKDVTFRGRNNTAIVLGAVAMGLSGLVLLIQICYGSMFCCIREPKTIFQEAEEVDEEVEEDDGEDEGEDEGEGV